MEMLDLFFFFFFIFFYFLSYLILSYLKLKVITDVNSTATTCLQSLIYKDYKNNTMPPL